MKALRYILVAAWTIVILVVGLAFAFPRPMSRILGPMASFFHLIPAALFIMTAVYVVGRLYRAGMRR
jgi:hypothetical protein